MFVLENCYTCLLTAVLKQPFLVVSAIRVYFHHVGIVTLTLVAAVQLRRGSRDPEVPDSVLHDAYTFLILALHRNRPNIENTLIYAHL